MIEGVDGDLILSDNFFDMEKGEKRVVKGRTLRYNETRKKRRDTIGTRRIYSGHAGREAVDFIYHEFEKDIMEELKNILTEFEKEVLDLKIIGYNFDEIANTLDKDIKSIYNTFHRIKLKIKKIINEDDYL